MATEIGGENETLQDSDEAARELADKIKAAEEAELERQRDQVRHTHARAFCDADWEDLDRTQQRLINELITKQESNLAAMAECSRFGIQPNGLAAIIDIMITDCYKAGVERLKFLHRVEDKMASLTGELLEHAQKTAHGKRLEIAGAEALNRLPPPARPSGLVTP